MGVGMSIIEINRKSDRHDDYYGVVELDYDAIVMIANALYKYHKNADSEIVQQRSKFLKSKWNDFRDMVCYGEVCARLADED